MIKAIIFDMDGVISDTEVAQSEAEAKLLKKYGINLTTEEIMEKYSGVKDREWIGALIKEFNLSVNLDNLIEEKYQKLMRVEIRPMDGSVELINNFKNNDFKLAVASASPPEFINLVLRELKISGKFEILTSASELEKGKPDPQIFLLAAQRLKLKPEECLVIEDGINGMIAAKRAKMKCIGLVKIKDYQKYPADLLVNSLKEINLENIQKI